MSNTAGSSNVLHIYDDRQDEPQGTDPAEVAQLLEDVRGVFAKFIVLDEHQLDTLALWTAHTYTYRSFDVTPYLAIMSPVMRSGKTNLLTVFEQLAYEPLKILHTTTAGLYNTINDLRPTMLFDEMDMQKLSRTAKGILNGGYKTGAFITIQEGRRRRVLHTYCPKAFASIGRALTPTLSDRSIEIHMRRKLPSEVVEPFNTVALAEAAGDVPDRLSNFRADFILGTDEPEYPPVLNDRERELWRPLFHIAALAGDGWTTRAWNACLALTRSTRNEEVDPTVELLADIRKAFGQRERLFSEELLNRIRNLEEPAYTGPATNSKTALADALAPFQVFPRTVRIGTQTKRGYQRRQFDDSFARYIVNVDS